MQKKLVITIRKPCHEGWGQMTPVEKGRFCSHCQKTVVDFTGYSDAELYRALSGSVAGESICGHMRIGQLQRAILPPVPQRRLYRMAVALGLSILFSGSAAINARPRAPFSFNPVKKHKHHGLTGNDTTSVSGIVYANYDGGKPLRGARVKLLKGSDELYSVLTNADGRYCLLNVVPGNYDMYIECNGYERNVHRSIKLPVQSILVDTLNSNQPVLDWETADGQMSIDVENLSMYEPIPFDTPGVKMDTLKPALPKNILKAKSKQPLKHKTR